VTLIGIPRYDALESTAGEFTSQVSHAELRARTLTSKLFSGLAPVPRGVGDALAVTVATVTILFAG
jgi:hypothetical protein